MVYEKECAVCERVIDFGGKDRGRLPENAMEFNGDIYCRECVEHFVEFGIGDVREKITDMEEDLDKIKNQLGIE